MQLAKIPQKLLIKRGIEALDILFGNPERVKIKRTLAYRINHEGEPLLVTIKTGFRFISALRSADDTCWPSLEHTDHVIFCTEGDAEGSTIRRYLFSGKAVREAFDEERARRIAAHTWNHANRTYIDPLDAKDEIVRTLMDAASWADAVPA